MIRLFTDSAANLPPSLAEQWQITVIPFVYTLNGTEYSPQDPSFDGAAFYRAMREGADVKTSLVNSMAFAEYFDLALRLGEDVLYIGLSGGVSGTAQAARVAAEELREKYPQRQICVVDSLGASLGEGLLAVLAAKLIHRGENLEKIERCVRQHILQMHQCFTVDDLKWLKKTGRVSAATAAIGGALGIHPVLVGDPTGHIVSVAKARGERRVLEALVERYDRLATDKAADIGIAHADNPEGLGYLLKRLREVGFTGHALTVIYEPITGAHVGPGAVALFFLGHDRADLLAKTQ